MHRGQGWHGLPSVLCSSRQQGWSRAGADHSVGQCWAHIRTGGAASAHGSHTEPHEMGMYRAAQDNWLRQMHFLCCTAAVLSRIHVIKRS